MLTQDLLNEIFTYDPETGVLERKVPVNRVGRPSERGWYPAVWVGDKTHAVHRLIWLLVSGHIPAGMFIDHVNGVKNDNRLVNLRLVTRSGNSRNSCLPKSNSTGYKGVTAEGSSFRARLLLNGTRKHIGLFDTPEAAAGAYDRAAVECFGEHARTNAMMGLLPNTSANA